MAEILGRQFNRPSSTISAATLAGMAMTLIWEIAAQAGFEARGSLVAASVAFASGLAGYLKRENVIGQQEAGEHEAGSA